ncbi:MAG: PKD domain-containing protein [Bacteroidales bacterium]|nr:PKD domain-containing protein [Bacteroidales bacterium]
MKTRHTLYIIVLLLFGCVRVVAQSSFTYNLTSFSDWVNGTNTPDKVWKYGKVSNPYKYSNLPSSTESYFYISDNDVNLNGYPHGQASVYSVSRKFDFADISMPIISFDIYFYFDESQSMAQNPQFRIWRGTDSNNGVSLQGGYFHNNLSDGWEHISICDASISNKSDVQLNIEVDSYSGTGFVVAIKNFKITGFNIQNITSNNATCYGYEDGSIEIQVDGGGPTYQFSKSGAGEGAVWEPAVSVTNYTFSNLKNATYNIAVKDVTSGCWISPNPVVVRSSHDELQFSFDAKDVTCYTSDNGKISITPLVSGSITDYLYSVDNGKSFQNSNTFDNLPSGSYNVVMKTQDLMGCVSQPKLVELGTNVLLEYVSVTPNSDDIKCYGEAKGSIQVDAHSALGELKYSFELNGVNYPGNTMGEVYNLPEGDYTVTITDKNKCYLEYPQKVKIKGPEKLEYQGCTTVDVSVCYGKDNGSITFNQPTGGTGSYMYSIDGENYTQSSPIFENLVGDYSYKLSVRDENLCKTSPIVVALNQPSKVSITKVLSTNVTSCYGDNTGSIDIIAMGGTGLLKYSILPDRNDYQSNNKFFVEAGTYYPKVEDEEGCSAEYDEQIITQPNPLVLNTVEAPSNMIKCNGDATGVINCMAIGGTSPYYYSIDNLSGGISKNYGELCTFSSLAAGSYLVKVTDSKSCVSDKVEVKISEPTLLTLSILSHSDATCYNKSDAEVVLEGSGGSSNYTFYYQRNNTGYRSSKDNKLSSLLAGNYNFKVMDGNNCESSILNLELKQPNELVADPQVTDVSTCYDDDNGKIEVVVTGGTEPYSYSINNGPYQSSNVFDNLAFGYYNIKVDDNNHCSGDAAFHRNLFVNAPTQLSISNFSYKNVEGCKGTSSGKISFDVGGGYGTVVFSNDGGNSYINETRFRGIDFLNLPAGVYYPIAKDERGCTVQGPTVVISEPEKLEISSIKTDSARCYGDYSGSVHITVVGGKQRQAQFPYSFYLNGSTVPDNYTGEFRALPAGDYTFIAEDEYGCQIPVAFSIKQPDEIKVVQKDSTNITTCYGDRTGTVTLKVAGGIEPFTYIAKGYNYYDENTTGHFTDLPASGYELIATDAHKCSVDTIVTIEQPTKFAYHAKITNEIMCHGDDDAAIEVSASGGTAPYYFSFDNGKTYPYTESSYSNVNPGRYYVKAKDSKGCTHDYVYDLEIIDPPQLEADYEKYDVICNTGNTGKILASAKGGTKPYQFSIDEKVWRYNSGVFSNLTDSTYSVTVKDGHNCSVKLTDITLTRPPNIAGFTVNESEGCSPLLVTMTQDNTGGLTTYDISDGTKIYDCTGPTSYTFVNRTGHTETFVIKATMMQAGGVGCTDTASLQVKVLPQPDSDVRVTNSSAIFPETTINFANMTQNITEAKWDFDDDTYSDNINEQSHTYKSCGKYNITLIQSNGMCYDTLSIPFVIEGRPVIAAMKANNIQGCQPVTVEFTNSSSNSDSCVWNFGDGTTSTSPMLKHTFEGAGDYEVTLTAYGDCGAASTTSKTIHVYAQPSAGFTQNADTLYEGQALHLSSVSEGGAYYAWDFGDGKKSDEKHPVHNYEFGGTFTISLIVTSPNSCSDTAFVKNAVTVIKSPIVVFPNAFTPDGDGLNDIFLPVHGDISQFKIFIFDKKGQLMYKGTDITEGWDGTRNGHPCPTGVYVYKANIVLRDKSFYDLKGYVVLLRLPAKK